MSQATQPAADERLPLRTFTEKAYLDYSMYVILDRALPHVGDGLKPVQRRIVYAMSELGLKASAKYKKSARTVGDVIGKFHPHGDSAAYEAMVLMAQPFSFRYPLVDGQGNWGSQDDPKAFAAMRYTEARLSAYAELLLGELTQGTADWHPNFDGTLDEPEVLPAQVPTVLLNGTTGIAVGMATDIPPHNLREVVAATVHLLQNPKATTRELCEFLPGPDMPTRAEIITAREDLITLYETGRGSVRMRALWKREDGEIVITALPFQVSGAKVLEQIAAQMQAKKLPMLQDLRDESDHESPTRLVLVPRSGRVDAEALMQHLFATTDLEKSYRVNLNLIGINGRPGVRSLQQILSEWLAFRTDTVRRRLQHRLDWVARRLHLLDGLLIAFLNLDEVIHIIRTEEHPRAALIERFKLSEDQANYILDTRLRQLARLEEMKIRGEQSELAKEQKELQGILDSERKLKNLLKKELEACAKQYGDERLSPLVERAEAQAFSEAELLGSEPVTVVVSAKGWIRAARGHDLDPGALSYRAGDAFALAVRGKTNEAALLLDSSGRSYSLAAHQLPSARGQGEPLSSRLAPPSGAEFIGLLMGDNSRQVVLATTAGYGFVATYGDFAAKNRTGKALLTVPAGGRVLPPAPVPSPQALLVAVTSDGRMLCFTVSELPLLARGKGNKIIGIATARLASGEEALIGLAVLEESQQLKVWAGKRHLLMKYKDLEHYRGERGRRGHKLPRGFQRVDRLEPIS